ncbi:KAT8 regulatory NSL complex subunit 1 isoform X2 [Anabrus simplex]|uniref:KAT8 regulatory NSL complex subunit 1 isoform X2 n=1 Tax=Anabrus simplex TaxID=316456 RepID=UPI0035A29755
MGMRFASLRRPDVVVMAPALTEAGQSQNFKLPPSTHSTPASPLGVTLNGLKSISVSHFISDGHLLCKDGHIETKLNNSDTLNGVNKNFKKNVTSNQDSNGFGSLTVPVATPEVFKTCEVLHTTEQIGVISATPYSQEGSFMMNNCDPSMGDQEDNMGLQKSNSSGSTLEAGKFLKKGMNDMDQLFKNLGAAISVGGLGNGGDLGQNVDDLFQAMDNMESGTTESDVQLPGDAVGLGNLDPTENVGPESMFPMPDGADLAGLSTFEREFLNEVDMMDMCVDVNLGDNSLVVENKGLSHKVRTKEAAKKQFELERKSAFLIRRAKKLMARTMGQHVAEEVTGVLEQAHRMMKQSASSEFNNQSGLLASAAFDASGTSNRKEKKVRGISSYAMASLFRRLEMLSQQQAALSSRHQVPNKYFGAGSSDHVTTSSSSNGPRAVPKFNYETKEELEQVSGQLYTQLKMVENAMDSDATASSSGGESCDEMQSYNNPHQLPLSISKRAAWRWAQDRAGVAFRWTWLNAQISDLEYRIRQHNEIHRQIRAAKGHVCLGEHPVVNAANTTTSTMTAASGRPNNHHPPIVVNGFHGTLPGGAGCKPQDGGGESSTGCSRTRPLLRSVFRKRKLLQTAGLHLGSKKAARPTTVRCGCRPPLSWCALCTGRADPTQPQQPDLLTTAERIALLDPCFHPVLSFPEDVPQRIHYEAIMKTAEWQQKTLRSSLKALKASGIPKLEKDSGLERRNKKQQVEHRRKYTSRLKKSATSTLTAKLKRKLSKGRKPKGHDPNNHSLQRLKRKRASSKPGLTFLNVSNSLGIDEGEDDSRSMEAAVTLHASPVPSPGPSLSQSAGVERLSSALAALKERGDGVRRKRENSYDIDNIVIPYSIAASTRVEKLQYKEIPTPKWRVCEYSIDTPLKLDLKNNGVVRRSSQESDMEDLSEETIGQRHDRCELEEKKKFMSYIKFPHSGRGRAQRRADSRAESSGANTPDPMSPNNMLDHHIEAGGSPLTSPPATPLPINQECDTSCLPLGSRRRTVSQSRWAKDREDVQCGTPEHVVEVPPYESRTFPLSDDIYEKMLKSMPEGHPYPPLVMEPKKSTKDDELDEVSRPVSPSTDSTESALGEGEDPNDPEWTVEEEKEFEREKTKNMVKR